MNTIDLYTRWSSVSLDDIEAELQAGDTLPTAAHLFGTDEVAQMIETQGKRGVTGPRKAVVLLPGLMGSLLTSIRGTTTPLWLNPTLILKGTELLSRAKRRRHRRRRAQHPVSSNEPGTDVLPQDRTDTSQRSRAF